MPFGIADELGFRERLVEIQKSAGVFRESPEDAKYRIDRSSKWLKAIWDFEWTLSVVVFVCSVSLLKVLLDAARR